MKFSAAFLFFVLLSSATFAGENSAKKSFDRINNCVKQEDSASCKNLFTAASRSLYERFISYNLIGCLPKDAEYVSEKKDDDKVIVRASATDLNKKRFMRLIFVSEGGRWKLDIPASLQRAMGKNWEKQIEVIEQIYLLMQAQLGNKLDCKTIRSLAGANK